MKYSKLKVAVLAVTAAVSLPAFAIPITTDIISVVDESGSMSTEHAWLGSMMTALDAAFATEAGGDTFSPQYGLTGFGANSTHGTSGHKHLVGGSEFGTATEYGTATGTLIHSGGFEDGYQAMDYALNNYTLRANAVTNIILVTDEDRDGGGGFTFDGMVNALASENALLNAVLNIQIRCDDNSVALGLDDTGTGYVANGSGGFNTCIGASVTSGAGSSETDYADLALETGGAVWDLNQLRAGGLTATSFTAAFVDIKVQETISQEVPEPSTLILLGLGLAGVGFSRKKIKA